MASEPLLPDEAALVILARLRRYIEQLPDNIQFDISKIQETLSCLDSYHVNQLQDLSLEDLLGQLEQYSPLSNLAPLQELLAHQRLTKIKSLRNIALTGDQLVDLSAWYPQQQQIPLALFSWQQQGRKFSELVQLFNKPDGDFQQLLILSQDFFRQSKHTCMPIGYPQIGEKLIIEGISQSWLTTDQVPSISKDLQTLQHSQATSSQQWQDMDIYQLAPESLYAYGQNALNWLTQSLNNQVHDEFTSIAILYWTGPEKGKLLLHWWQTSSKQLKHRELACALSGLDPKHQNIAWQACLQDMSKTENRHQAGFEKLVKKNAACYEFCCLIAFLSNSESRYAEHENPIERYKQLLQNKHSGEMRIQEELQQKKLLREKRIQEEEQKKRLREKQIQEEIQQRRLLREKRIREEEQQQLLREKQAQEETQQKRSHQHKKVFTAKTPSYKKSETSIDSEHYEASADVLDYAGDDEISEDGLLAPQKNVSESDRIVERQSTWSKYAKPFLSENWLGVVGAGLIMVAWLFLSQWLWNKGPFYQVLAGGLPLSLFSLGLAWLSHYFHQRLQQSEVNSPAILFAVLGFLIWPFNILLSLSLLQKIGGIALVIPIVQFSLLYLSAKLLKETFQQQSLWPTVTINGLLFIPLLSSGIIANASDLVHVYLFAATFLVLWLIRAPGITQTHKLWFYSLWGHYAISTSILFIFFNASPSGHLIGLLLIMVAVVLAIQKPLSTRFANILLTMALNVLAIQLTWAQPMWCFFTVLISSYHWWLWNKEMATRWLNEGFVAHLLALPLLLAVILHMDTGYWIFFILPSIGLLIFYEEKIAKQESLLLSGLSPLFQLAPLWSYWQLSISDLLPVSLITQLLFIGFSLLMSGFCYWRYQHWYRSLLWQISMLILFVSVVLIMTSFQLGLNDYTFATIAVVALIYALTVYPEKIKSVFLQRYGLRYTLHLSLLITIIGVLTLFSSSNVLTIEILIAFMASLLVTIICTKKTESVLAVYSALLLSISLDYIIKTQLGFMGDQGIILAIISSCFVVIYPSIALLMFYERKIAKQENLLLNGFALAFQLIPLWSYWQLGLSGQLSVPLITQLLFIGFSLLTGAYCYWRFQRWYKPSLWQISMVILFISIVLIMTSFQPGLTGKTFATIAVLSLIYAVVTYPEKIKGVFLQRYGLSYTWYLSLFITGFGILTLFSSTNVLTTEIIIAIIAGLLVLVICSGQTRSALPVYSALLLAISWGYLVKTQLGFSSKHGMTMAIIACSLLVIYRLIAAREKSQDDNVSNEKNYLLSWHDYISRPFLHTAIITTFYALSKSVVFYTVLNIDAISSQAIKIALSLLLLAGIYQYLCFHYKQKPWSYLFILASLLFFGSLLSLIPLSYRIQAILLLWFLLHTTYQLFNENHSVHSYFYDPIKNLLQIGNWLTLPLGFSFYAFIILGVVQLDYISLTVLFLLSLFLIHRYLLANTALIANASWLHGFIYLCFIFITGINSQSVFISQLINTVCIFALIQSVCCLVIERLPVGIAREYLDCGRYWIFSMAMIIIMISLMVTTKQTLDLKLLISSYLICHFAGRYHQHLLFTFLKILPVLLWANSIAASNFMTTITAWLTITGIESVFLIIALIYPNWISETVAKDRKVPALAISWLAYAAFVLVVHFTDFITSTVNHHWLYLLLPYIGFAYWCLKRRYIIVAFLAVFAYANLFQLLGLLPWLQAAQLNVLHIIALDGAITAFILMIASSFLVKQSANSRRAIA